jgi:hypothetical protein
VGLLGVGAGAGDCLGEVLGRRGGVQAHTAGELLGQGAPQPASGVGRRAGDLQQVAHSHHQLRARQGHRLGLADRAAQAPRPPRDEHAGGHAQLGHDGPHPPGHQRDEPGHALPAAGHALPAGLDDQHLGALTGGEQGGGQRRVVATVERGVGQPLGAADADHVALAGGRGQ